jgi:hypothetical protein
VRGRRNRQAITFDGIDVVRFRDGKAAGAWHQGDDLAIRVAPCSRLPAFQDLTR